MSKLSKPDKLHSQVSEQRSDNSQKSNADEEDEDAEEINAPKIDRNLSYQPDFSHIIINIAFTHYPVVKEVSLSLGIKIIDDPLETNWDVCWTDLQVTPHTFIRMHFHQSINYIPGIYTIARKNELGKNLNAMKSHFPLDYNFHPPTWMLPEDYHLLRKHFQTGKFKNQTFIVKPQAECQGRGIYLVSKLQQIQIGKHCVVQRYVPNPLLIEGYKFDLRVYVLIGSIDPLRIYLFNDGLGRFATEGYQAPHQSNFRSNYQHLTNYAINKLNPKFKAAQSGGQGEGGFKRSLLSVMKLLKEMGADTDLIWSRIKQISVKTIITSYEHIRHNYLKAQPEEYHNRMAFHILGLDVLITDTLEPILLQVNHTPSFATETPLDSRIKFALIRDTLKLMQLDSIELKKQLFNKAKTYSNNRVEQGKRQSLDEQVRSKQILVNLQKRIQFQKDNLGGYQVIFPFEDLQRNERFNHLIEKAKAILYNKPTRGDKSESEIALKQKKKRGLKEAKQCKQVREFSKQPEKINELKSTKSIRNHSMYNQRFIHDPQVIQQTLKSFYRNDLITSNHPQNLLFNLNTRNNRTFTIKTKHSLAEVAKKEPLRQQYLTKKQRQKPMSRHFMREGNFLKPKTYDVPTLRQLDDHRTIHKKKELKYIQY